MNRQYINRGSQTNWLRMLLLAFIIHHSSFIIANAQNTYTLPTASCQSACGIETIDGWIGFMCYNLGAETSTLDPFSYNGGAINGDYYQWGRPKDGHQLKNSPTTTTLSATGIPGNNRFILSGSGITPSSWMVSQDYSLWGFLKTPNDPCPAGYKVPTSSQWSAIGLLRSFVWTGNGSKVGSSLYLPAAGWRDGTNAPGGELLYFEGQTGYYWTSSSITGSGAQPIGFYFRSTTFFLGMNNIIDMPAGRGLSIRCIAE
ncbi:hypothetical protein EXU85_27460 [Spirosoma sp. KCTC 42546]|uniref:FISUMP domain-containing protein n=1 Tax=Spirosoma sp. KCTC 42546 TaxID=2520506 RepID=UPI00115A46EF|nr:FISUMP domain-containing protein [Spirosoma sp. KCTC 42546]QDK82145.1 hypothetical protein EXU85_27460 [Spirosoma sp. KCTC 42546]